MFFWSVKYTSLVVKLFIIFWKCQDTHTNIVYIGKYLVLLYIENLFSTVWCFLPKYLFTSVNPMNWVSKFQNFFPTCSETEARFIFESLKYCPLWKVHFQLSGIFIAFFIWSINCSREFFSRFVGQYISWIESLSYVTYFGDIQKLKH